MIKDRYTLEMCLNCIENVCWELDFLSDPAVEEKMICSFDCCIGNSGSRDIFENPPEELRDLLGDKGLRLTHQLDEVIMQGIKQADYGEKEGFSKTQAWLDFVCFIKKVDLFLQDILRKHGRIID